MPIIHRALLLVGSVLPVSTLAQLPPPTPNQAAAESRREIQNSRREARENLDRGVRGEIDPREVRRAREAAAESGSTVTPEIIARWQSLPPQQLGVDPDFVRAMQNDDPAALAHWEGVLIEMNSDLRADAGSRRWLGGPVLIPDQDTIEFQVRDRAAKNPSTRKRKPVVPEQKDERRRRNPMQERDAIERELREAGRHYDDAMRRRDDDPGNRELILAVEHHAARVRQIEERYQAFLHDNAPDEYRARRQERDAIARRMENSCILDRSQLPRRLDPAERLRTPPLQDYDGGLGTNPDHRLRGTVDGGEGPVIPGRANRQPPAERPQRLPLPEYEGRPAAESERKEYQPQSGGN